MEKKTRNKIVAINMAINDELETLTLELEYRTKRIAKLKDKILEILNDEL